MIHPTSGIALYLFVIITEIADWGLASFRTTEIAKGRAKLAAVVIFFEMIVYMSVLGNVINVIESHPLVIVAYGFGAAIGSIFGNYFSDKRKGILNLLMIITNQEKEIKITNILKKSKIGFTILDGEGKDKKKSIFVIALKGENVKLLKNNLKKIDPYIVFANNKNVSSIGTKTV